MSVAILPEIKKIIASFTNITERKKTEVQLQNLANELKTLNENKNLFFSIIAHDLRNPIASIITLSGFLLDDKTVCANNELKNEITTMNNVSKQAFYLLEDLLSWSISQDGKIRFEPQKINFATLSRDVFNSVKVTAGEKNISIALPSDAVYVFADIDMLRTILRNLLTNAIKYTNKEGRIEIEIENSENNSTIIVKDNGTGIKPENIKKLWTIAEKFSTKGTANERGSGLGLILCKEFVEKHGGIIWVETEWGMGCAFKFTLPNIELQSNPKLTNDTYLTD
jgi:signal transduction histidine kinase